jgi:hypothetical protein
MAENERPEEVQRWTAKRCAALVISLVKGETMAVGPARRDQLLKPSSSHEVKGEFLELSSFWIVWTPPSGLAACHNAIEAQQMRRSKTGSAGERSKRDP